ncbi:MAG: hypothetical protein M1829_002086 [Trizodia sp. TS-e1964]|nr:MAG: hypothetical protein M1829_002086 [Trizodia sp. TS-e1964]
MADSLSIEEANRVRAAIGLKPLPIPGSGPVFRESQASATEPEEETGSTLESRQAEGFSNWKAIQEEADSKAKRDARLESIRRARDAARRFAKLEGKGLGDAAENEEEEDTRSWLLKQKKRQRKIEQARKVEAELEERERLAAGDYSAKDLAGVKVAHELGVFEEGEEQVLVLKDATIDENEEEGDELENIEMREKEQLVERLNLKKKKPVYNPNDDETSGILAHYDEEIDGKKRNRFTLDGKGRTAEEKEAAKGEAKKKLNAAPISLEISKPIIESDYLDAADVKIRKPKKKKGKSTRQKAFDEDDIFPSTTLESNPSPIGDAMQIDSDQPATKKRTLEESSFIDDQDLQNSLALQRRIALKKRKKTRPEDIVRQFQQEEASNNTGMEIDNGLLSPDEEVGLVIDETSEFVANLQKPTVPQRRKPLASNATSMGDSHPLNATTEDDDDGDVNMDRAYADNGEASNPCSKSAAQLPPDITATGLEAEATLSRGIGSTVSLLSQRGLIAPPSSKPNLNALFRDRARFLTEKQQLEASAEKSAQAARARDRASGKLERMSAREREEHARWENKQRDVLESRQLAEIFAREYKPDVELKYVDEFGRAMGQKEAFKHLSHQFHGKGSGRGKTEKRLKKIEDEKRREAKSSLDSSETTGMNSAAGVAARKNRQAGVRLA